MVTRLLAFCLFFFFLTQVQAQIRTISGTIVDQQARTPLVSASVQLRSLSDSSVQRTLSDSLGGFSFTNLGRDSFLLSISFIGYNTVNRRISVDSSDINIDIAAAPSGSASELETVVIRTAVSPVTQKGDTLQINASQYKVNPDASGEDLVRKVPGITIENGQVKAQGENVQRVTIDGKELFGDDATAALRNLPAEIVDKIQIFDRLSDQAQFTGFDDGNTTKSINIVTKANMRNGQFGRVFAGYGTDSRYQAGGNATILKDNRRISLVGNFNNVNQQNFSQQDLLGVTSNAQRGGGGGGPRGGGGGPRGGSGNRGTGGNQGGGNFGGFGNSGNFLVGQQNGINKTNAFGINYTDSWGPKITATASYFFNNTNNNTNEIANTQYLSSAIINSLDTTISTSRNNNHRFNMRFEYKIDSFNQLIIIPNLSFQENSSVRGLNRVSFFDTTATNTRQTVNSNQTRSSRNGNNLNNTILYRHAFRKRGRSFSVNVNTSYNNREGETYLETFQRQYLNTGIEDSSTRRLTDQASNGLQVSSNFVYTEPIGKSSQLQFNYNPSFSKSTSDQETFGYNPAEDKYSAFLENLSNKFENTTNAHNGGISYRYNTRERQFSFGANYQSTTLKSEQTYPQTLNVNKSFTNILPNAMLRLNFSTRSNVRFMYRANVNQPSVTQLQNVVDITRAPVYTVGDPDLAQQYTHVLSGRYTYTNPTKGMLFVANVFWQAANNYIANATYTPAADSAIGFGIILRPGDQLNKPINLDGYSSFRSFLTFAVPVGFIKSNLNLNGGVTISTLPGFINYVETQTNNTTYNLGLVVGSNISQYVDFTVSYSANFNQVKNEIQPSLNNNYFQHVAGVQLNLLSKKGWFFQNDLNNQFYNGLSEGFNQNYFLWNMSAGKKLLKDQKGELRLSVFDLLKQNRSITRNITETYIEDVQNQVLQQYFMLTFTYNLRNFGTAAARAANRANQSPRR
ncbi:MAG TPA: outer membrane beta-barrel protein [Flavisolibacter sp.]|nr:outer membrane beta-barrel protein [Flavisolibacter sp.]